LAKAGNYSTTDELCRNVDRSANAHSNYRQPAFCQYIVSCQQVNWELDYLEKVEYRVFYFAENTLSPVSLLEYGKFFDYENTYIAAHPNYNRIGNLQIFCHRHGIRLHQSVDDLVTIISPKTYF